MTFDELNTDDLLDVQLITGVEVQSVFEQVNSFLKNEAPQIRAFFEGRRDSVVAQQFKKLKSLLDLLRDTIDNLSSFKEELNLYKHWVVFEILEDSVTTLNTLNNYSLWSRSNRNINIYAGDVEIDYVQQQDETLEQIEIKAGSIDSNWYQIAVRNSLQEEDYDSEGGKNLKIIFRNAPTAFLESVIDQIDNGLKSYGIDISKKIQFSGDDLVKLSNKETLLQSADILLNLKKGDNPSIPQLGLDRISILGSSKSSFLFPVVFRQLIEVFSTDDTFSSVEFGKINFQQDAIFIDVQVQSRFRETVEGLIQL